MHGSGISGALKALALAAAVIAAAPAAAGSLQVDPIRLEIGAERRSATLRVRNEEQVPVTIRAYGLDWVQEGGEEHYADSDALILSPPIFTIPPGGTQLVRIGLRTPAASGRSYRVMIEEVPEASPGGVQVALRLNLPLFASVDAGSPSDLAWKAWRSGEGGWTVEASNRGAGYVRLDPETAAAATGIHPSNGINFGTILPGSTRRWAIGPSPALADEARFRAMVHSGHGGGNSSLPALD